MIARVHPEILRARGRLPDRRRRTGQIWRERYDSILGLERHLHRNGTRIVKFFLHLSKEEQRKRFLQRLDDPDKRWKFSQADLEERKYWRALHEGLRGVSRRTRARHHAPWYVVPADDKKNARLMVSQVIVETLAGLKMQYPALSESPAARAARDSGGSSRSRRSRSSRAPRKSVRRKGCDVRPAAQKVRGLGVGTGALPAGTAVAVPIETAMKIVCATDFTQRSQAAAQVAVDLARRTGGWVELVHVMKPGTVDILALAADAVVLEEEVRASVEARLAAECDRLTTADIPVTFHVCEGDVETAVLRAPGDLGGPGRRRDPRAVGLAPLSPRQCRRGAGSRPIGRSGGSPGVEGLGVGQRRRQGRCRSWWRSTGGARAPAPSLRARPARSRRLRRDLPAALLGDGGVRAPAVSTGPRDLFAPDAEVVADLERALRLEVGVLPGTGRTSFVIKPAWGEPAAQDSRAGARSRSR